MAAVFRMLSSPARLQVLCLCLDRSVSVGDLVDSLKLSQSLVSHHLKLLREANLIQATRRGKKILYKVRDKRVRCILEDMVSHANTVVKKEQG